ncbi:MAG: hypothetical protein H6728_07785 [Myxococcales bacterium]|nr:hypothetical protein [Myxococcales bacterium]
MFRRACAIGLFFCLWIACCSDSWAGPWVGEPGHGYAKLGVRWLPGFGYYSGEREGGIPVGTYHELSLQAYGEVSIAPRLALTLSMPVVRQFFLDDVRQKTLESHTTWGDPSLGARVMVWNGYGFAVGLEASVKIPLNRGGSIQPVYSEEAGNPKVADLRAGTGTLDVYGGLSVGFARDRFYVLGGVGYMYRTLGFDHLLLWNVEGGYRFHPAWSVRVRIHSVHLLGNGDAPYQETLNGAGNGTEYGAFAVEGEWMFRPGMVLGLSIEAGLWSVKRQSGGPVISLYWAMGW